MRLASYRLSGEATSVSFARYQWNIQLAESLLPCLNYLEIGLRNSLNRVVIGLYGTEWLLNPPVQLNLSYEDKNQIENLKDNLLKIKGYHASHDDILAQLTFGFWISLFHKRYAAGIWHRGQNPLAEMFPHMLPVYRTREIIFTRLKHIKSLRNRIAHHEPIWKLTPDVNEIHTICLDLIAALSMSAATELAKIDRFDSVYGKGYTVV